MILTDSMIEAAAVAIRRDKFERNGQGKHFDPSSIDDRDRSEAWAALFAARGVEMRRRLYLDLDGVLADFDAHFPALFGVNQHTLSDDEMWAKVAGHGRYFESMPVMPGAVEFFRDIEHLQPIILTACPRSDYPAAARQKRGWVRRHLSPHVTVLPVLGGANKRLFMQEPGDILIDDFAMNCEAWRAEGGVAILHTNFTDTMAGLAEALSSPSAGVE